MWVPAFSKWPSTSRLSGNYPEPQPSGPLALPPPVVLGHKVSTWGLLHPTWYTLRCPSRAVYWVVAGYPTGHSILQTCLENSSSTFSSKVKATRNRYSLSAMTTPARPSFHTQTCHRYYCSLTEALLPFAKCSTIKPLEEAEGGRTHHTRL